MKEVFRKDHFASQMQKILLFKNKLEKGIVRSDFFSIKNVFFAYDHCASMTYVSVILKNFALFSCHLKVYNKLLRKTMFLIEK